MGAAGPKFEACPKHQLSLLGLGELVSLAGVLLGEQGSGLKWLRLGELGSGLRRLRPSFRVMQLSHKSKSQGKQANLENKSEARIQVNLEKIQEFVETCCFQSTSASLPPGSWNYYKDVEQG